MGSRLLVVRNILKVWALFLVVCAILGAIGWFVDGYRLSTIFIFCGLLLGAGVYWYADRAVLGLVLARELAHIRHRDVLVQSVAALIAAVLIETSRLGGWFSRALLFVLGPIASAFVHLLLSPKREFDADRGASAICGSPHGLAAALIRLDQASELVAFRGSPAAEPLYTIDPFEEEGLAGLFVTHPAVLERVRRLRSLDPQGLDALRAA